MDDVEVASKSYPRQYRAIWDEVSAALERAFFEDDPILGSAVDGFEDELARYHEVGFAVGVGSGTDALVLALRELGVGSGDEVVTCGHTFSGVVSALRLSGATPILVDPDPESGLLDASGVEGAVGPRTRAVLAVHLYGHPVDVDALGEVCRRHGLLLIEDAAQAHGARWRGRPVGSAGVVAALSFHPSKNLGAFGDGGALLTGDARVAAGLRTARNLGKTSKHQFARTAPNTKLDTLQAAILRVKLRYLDSWVERRNALARRYRASLAGVGDLVLPHHDPCARHAYHLFVVRTARRDALQQHLKQRGIRAGLHYPIAAHLQPAFADLPQRWPLPHAEAFARSVLTLPLSHEHQDSEIDRVIEEVRDFFGS